MNRREVVLAGLAPANGCAHSPVQVQKLFFLIDREIPRQVGGPFFQFRPYNYGPFDGAVYEQLEALASEGLVEVTAPRPWREFRLTEAGQREGNRLLEGLPDAAKDFIRTASEFVRRLSFQALVSAVYKAYPEMRENSVFKEYGS